MFVLCPHCHFLVGMDPRTGGPPAACPKCGGTVVEPVAATRSEAAALDPFAEAALPSVAPMLPSVEPLVDAEPDAKPGRSAATAAARSGEPMDAAPSSGTDASVASAPAMDAGGPDAPEPVAAASDGRLGAADAPRYSATADEMIAALATRPARKPRAPRTRTRKPTTTPKSAPEAEASTPNPVAAGEPSAPTPSAAAGLGARIRRLFARTPRQPDSAQASSPDATAAPVPDASPDAADAAPATPALSIRNRRKRTASRDVEPPSAAAPTAGPVDAAATDDGPVSTPVIEPAAETGSVGGTPPDANPDALPATLAPAVDDDLSPGADAPPGADASPPAAARSSPRDQSPGQDRGEVRSDDLASSADAPTDARAAPPENIDAATAALLAATPAAGTRAEAITQSARHAPSFATAHATKARAHRDFRALGAALALTLALGLQLLLAQRAVLAADPGWRPAIAALCGVLRCTLPPWREPAAFTMLSRHVRPHPDAPGTLLIDASFRNDARWPQPWPRLELTLSDVDGRTVGARTFDAREYLGAPPTQSELAPGQSASLSLAVVEPAPDIVSFTFDFR